MTAASPTAIFSPRTVRPLPFKLPIGSKAKISLQPRSPDTNFGFRQRGLEDGLGKQRGRWEA